MKIKKELYLIPLLFILMPFESIFSQQTMQMDADIEMLKGMIARQGQSKQGNLAESEGNDTSEETAEPKTIREQESNFEDKNYGYTGGKNFVNPPQGKFFDEPLSYFGYDFFVDAPTTFSPAESIPIPPDYILGTNDSVRIILFGGNNDDSHELDITRDGEIIMPGIGPISVGGLTFQDFKEIIEQIVATRMVGTAVSVTMGKLRSMDIFVLGEAYQPGMYTVSSLATLTNAIFQSGGVNVTGSLRNIQLKRNGKVISTFDFYDLLLKGDTRNDTRLMQGDVVFIPPITKTVGTAGEVGRPGIYELKADETLGDLIKFAGNLKPKADPFSATVHRISISSGGFNLIPVALNDASLDSFELTNGDVLSIYSVVDNLKNAVLVTGHAQQPGFFPWKAGMRMGDLIKSKDNLLSMTDLNYVLIKRENELNQNYDFLQIDLEEIFSNRVSDSNILLESRDEIILFPSLLTPEQITTQLIQDNYVFENNQMTLVDDYWSSMTYLRKSLMDNTFNLGNAVQLDPLLGLPTGSEGQATGKYYEYSIYDYCTISEDLAISIVEAYGYRPKTKVPFEDLEKLSTSSQFDDLLQEIEDERSKLQDFETSGLELESAITNHCRKQLLEPVIDVLNRQLASTKEAKTISIFGNVYFPGIYPLTNEMVLEDSIKAAGGLKAATYDSEIEFNRSNNVGKRFSVTQSFASISDNHQTLQIPLKAMDVINLKQIATNTGTVEITGEVFFAGKYPITENQTLGQLINRAGGITDYGSADAAYFQRQSLKEDQIERFNRAREELKRKIVLSTQASGLGTSAGQSTQGGGGSNDNNLSDITNLIDDFNPRTEALGRLVIDLESIMEGLTEDIILQDGDVVHIPKIPQTVAVMGEVFAPNSHLFNRSLTIDDYIILSGGANDYADQENIYLIQADGSVITPSQLMKGAFFKRNISGELQPGVTIVVPLEVTTFSPILAATEVTQIIYQMAIAAAAVNSF